MKLIFLDVDGVLNHDHSIGWTREDGSSDWRVLDPENIFQINRIIRETGAKIVLSSTWRFNGEGLALLNECIIAGTIIGVTPNKRRRIHQNAERKEEILAWMADIWPHSFGWNGEDIDVLAVLDDDDDADLGEGSFFQTSFEEGGLTETIADRVIAHLKGE